MIDFKYKHIHNYTTLLTSSRQTKYKNINFSPQPEFGLDYDNNVALVGSSKKNLVLIIGRINAPIIFDWHLRHYFGTH